MKTSITIKETKQTLANKPESYGKYINDIVTSLNKADRICGLELGRTLYSAREKITSGEWGEDITSMAKFTEEYTDLTTARTTQILKGYEVYKNLYDASDLEPDTEEIKLICGLLENYTVTHFYELRSFNNDDILQLLKNDTINADMSVSELKKALKALTEPEEGDGDEPEPKDGDGDGDGDDENGERFTIRTIDDANELYNRLLAILDGGNTLTIDITTI